MKVNNTHTLEVNTEKEFHKIQKDLMGKIDLINQFRMEDIKYCAGVDLAYWEKDGVEYGVCSIIVLDNSTHEVIEKVYSYGEISTNYIAGFLAFRELPLVIEAAYKLSIEPDLFLFDGNGYLHFNHMGIATHASFFLDKPTIGVAKSYFKIRGNDFEMPQNQEGAYTDIMIDDEIYGRALRTRRDVKPIFISCGNYIDIDTATEVVRGFINTKESRLPIPVRLADLETHRLRSELNGHA